MAKTTMATRTEIIQKNTGAYRKATKKEKGAILDLVCASTGLSRDRAARLLGGKAKTGPKKRRRGRKPKYDKEFAKALEKMWYMMDFACGRRLAAGMGDMLEALEKHGEVDFGGEITAKLRTVSPATADRLLSAARRGLALKGRSTTKPGSLLKKDIPLRMGDEWDDAVPGFVEVDLVAHCGDTTAGDYVNTLSVTDISSGWTETAAVLNKAQSHVFAALRDIGGRQPFPYRGIDSDNGSEFINHHLLRWCKTEGIVFTRARPYRKNDNCHVEQKNWHVVRRNIGYARFEGAGAVAAMNEYYGLLRLYANYFLPQTKLIAKIREGGRVHKQYDRYMTPCQRLLGDGTVTEGAKAALREELASLNPAALKRDMEKALEKLEAMQMFPGSR